MNATIVVSGVCLFIFAVPTAFGQQSTDFLLNSRQPLTRHLGGGLIGGEQDDESKNVWDRVLSFDYENSYQQQLARCLDDWSSVFVNEPIPEREKRLLDKLVRDRLSLHSKNLEEFALLSQYERSRAIAESDRQDEEKEMMRKVLNIPSDVPAPTQQEINEAFLRYKKNEITAEKEFAEKVCELLPPALQTEFFRPMAMRGTQFIVHPFGVEYLGLSEQQTTRTRKLVSSEIAFRSESLRKAIAKSPNALQIAPGALPITDDTKKLIARKKFQSLSTLSREQLTKYLLLRGEITAGEGIESWLDKKSAEDQAIGAEVLKTQLAD